MVIEKRRRPRTDKVRDQERASYYRNREKALAAQKQYQLLHLDETRARNAKWYQANREYAIARSKEQSKHRTDERRAKDRLRAKITRDRIKREVFAHYSNGLPHCSCCGEGALIMLTLDHLNNDGGKHRKELGPVSTKMYRWAQKNGYPNMFAVLCFNCNVARHHSGGVCPHESERVVVVGAQQLAA